MSTAFTDFSVVFLANLDAEILIDLVQQTRRIHMLPLRGTTRAQVNLLGCVAVEQENAPGRRADARPERTDRIASGGTN